MNLARWPIGKTLQAFSLQDDCVLWMYSFKPGGWKNSDAALTDKLKNIPHTGGAAV